MKTRTLAMVALALLLAILVGCAKAVAPAPTLTPTPTPTPAPLPSPTPTSNNESTPTTVITWDVYKGDKKVLVVRNQPGPITSTAMLPPGGKPTQHPFLSAQAMDPFEEDNLRTILVQSRSFDEFISLLQANGYRLEKSK